MLHRNIDIQDIAFVDLSSHHRLVDRHCNLFSCTSFANILSDPLSSTVDERILRLDDPIKHFDSDNGRIATPEHEALQQLDLSGPDEKVHLRLCTRQSLSVNPARILFQNMIENIPLEHGNL